MNGEKVSAFIEEFDIKKWGSEIIDLAIGTIMLDPVSAKNLAQKIYESPIRIRDAVYWSKFYLFVKGVNEIHENLEDGVSLSSKLFGDDEKRKKNGMRILGYIDKVDSEYKIEYMVNATRCFLTGVINDETYFRIVKAIEETLYEDLLFLSRNVTKNSIFKGTPQILALARSGLTIVAGIDANEDVESQNYVITTLGKMVDQYAISLENEERWKMYKNTEKETISYDVNIPKITKEDIDKLFQ